MEPTGSGIKGIAEAFNAAKRRGRAALVPYTCGGYPTAETSVRVLLAMQRGGADVIELGVPCRDPFADGATLRASHEVAIQNGTAGLRDCLRIVEAARSRGLTAPVVLMGYYASLVEEYGGDVERMCRDAATSRANGFLAVGIGAGRQELEFNESCYRHGLSSIQLVMPGSTDRRIVDLAGMASTFLYVVSQKGKTGARDALPPGLNEAVARVRAKTDLPIVVGFGISKPEMVHGVSNLSDGAVVGSFLTDCMNKKEPRQTDEEIMYQKVQYLHTGSELDTSPSNQCHEFSQVPLQIKESRFARSMLARYRWCKAINAVRVCQAFGPLFD